MAEQRRFEVGMRVRLRYALNAQYAAGVYTVTAVNEIGGYIGIGEETRAGWLVEHFEPADTSPTADPVVGNARDGWEKIGNTWYGPLRQCSEMNDSRHAIREGYGCICGQRLPWEFPAPVIEQPKEPRWADKNGWRHLPLPADDPYAQHRNKWPDTFARMHVDASDIRTGRRDHLVAALAAEHTRQADSSGLLHPRSYWSGRNSGRRPRD